MQPVLAKRKFILPARKIIEPSAAPPPALTQVTLQKEAKQPIKRLKTSNEELLHTTKKAIPPVAARNEASLSEQGSDSAACVNGMQLPPPLDMEESKEEPYFDILGLSLLLRSLCERTFLMYVCR